ncbi:MAG TPA: TIGR03619 family F420-dependent LLM class oxidoreductase [Dehalococcoidia bacterium]|nr:TIGR03619 family F420-dependent LLM class oxidoreductase [Dehalococcoidia bacterium]
MSVRIGLGFAAFPFSSAEAFWRWIDATEETRVDSVWLSERLVGSQTYLEPLSTLAAVAGRTRRLKFGMNTTVLPMRDPLILAKECATIDYLSNGRMLPMFGVGNDNAPEWSAVGFESKGRGARSNEMLRLLNRLWTEDNVDFDGRYYKYRGVTINPKPKQSPLPLWIGGSSEAAIERTVRYGNGWLAGAGQSPAQIGRVISAIRERSAEAGRPIDDDHYGCGFSYRFGSWDEPVVQRNLQALQARLGADADPRAFMAVGGAEEVIELVTVLRAVGVSKFVARPIASSDDEMMEQSRLMAEEVIPHVHMMA